MPDFLTVAPPPVKSYVDATDLGFYSSELPPRFGFIAVGADAILGDVSARVFEFTNGFATFDLPGVHGTITGVTLRLQPFDWLSFDSSERVEIWSVTTPASTLISGSQQSNLAIFDDLQ